LSPLAPRSTGEILGPKIYFCLQPVWEEDSEWQASRRYGYLRQTLDVF